MTLLLFLVGGFFIGAVAWGNTLLLTIFSLLLWVGYFAIDRRLSFWLVALGYYLGASRGLFYGTAVYYEDYVYAGLIYIGAALITSFAWIIFWSDEPKKKILFFFLVQLLLLISPVALISWANPLQVAGLLFPSTGFFGLVLMVLVAIGFYVFHLKKITNTPMILMLFLLVATTDQKPIQIKSIESVISNFNYDNETNAMLDYQRQVGFLNMANKSKKDTLLFSENALGIVTKANEMIWSTLKEGKNVLAGGYLLSHDSNKSNNALFHITNKTMQPIYTQRIPVPIAMWKPWSNKGTQAHLDIFSNPMINIDGKKAGVLICYEQLIAPTYLHTFAYNPKMLLATSNLWWAKDTSIGEIQKEKVQLWALLFDVPYGFAYNF